MISITVSTITKRLKWEKYVSLFFLLVTIKVKFYGLEMYVSKQLKAINTFSLETLTS